MSILICGGAGYIGSHMASYLLKQGKDIVIIDNLKTGHKNAILGGKFYLGDLRNRIFLNKVFSENNIESVINFAAYSLVSESIDNPLKYFNNNILSTITLLDVMKDYGVNNFIFSSTAATYGDCKNIPIKEMDATKPSNPYGESKLAVEKILKWCNKAYGIKYSILRYFNAAGADINGNIGEDHRPESHLIPIALQVALGQRERIMIFGDDYDTPDGTCIRDYVHVSDLASAHFLALERSNKGGNSNIYNLGNGKGFSVKEVINTVKYVTGVNIKSEIAPRRQGDPPILIASSEKAIKELNWKPKYNSLEVMIATAWKWHKNHPYGYKQ